MILIVSVDQHCGGLLNIGAHIGSASRCAWHRARRACFLGRPREASEPAAAMVAPFFINNAQHTWTLASSVLMRIVILYCSKKRNGSMLSECQQACYFQSTRAQSTCSPLFLVQSLQRHVLVLACTKNYLNLKTTTFRWRRTGSCVGCRCFGVAPRGTSFAS